MRNMSEQEMKDASAENKQLIDVKKVLKYIGSKPPAYFDEVE